jgi:hypothetical protein
MNDDKREECKMRTRCEEVVDAAMDSRIDRREWEERRNGLGGREADPSIKFTVVEWWMESESLMISSEGEN